MNRLEERSFGRDVCNRLRFGSLDTRLFKQNREELFSQAVRFSVDLHQNNQISDECYNILVEWLSSTYFRREIQDQVHEFVDENFIPA